MRLARRVFSVLALFSAVTCSVYSSSPAAAQQPEGKRAGDPKRRADALLKEGADLAKAGKHEPALAKFEEAYALAPTGVASWNIARAEQSLGRYALALEHYRDALADRALGVDARRDAEKAVEELKTKIGVITLDVPPGATTTIDGNAVDAGRAIEVVPGKHVVKIRLADDSRSAEVVAPAGAVTPVRLRFGDDAPPPPPDPVAPPPPPAPPPPGAGGGTTGRTVAMVLGVASVAALGTGVGLRLAAGSKGDDADEAAKDPAAARGCRGVVSPACDAVLSSAESERDLTNASTGFLVGGAGLAVGAVASYFLWPGGAKRGREGVGVIPSVGRGSAAVYLRGFF